MSKRHSARFDPASDLALHAPSQVLDPSEANTCWEWLQQMAKIDFTVVAVEMKYAPATLQRFGPPEVLAASLMNEELGHFDSLKQGDPFTLFFYAFADILPAALQFIKGKLEQLGMLDLSKIGHADCGEKVWRTFHPAMPMP